MRDWKAYVRDRLPALGVRAEREMEIVEELAQQLEAVYAEARRTGVAEAEALRRAEGEIDDWAAMARGIRSAEGPAAVRETLGEPVRGWWGSGWFGDLRFGLRVMRRNPGFAAMAVLILGLGIGGCVAIYSLLEAVVLRPLEYKDPDRLAIVWEHNFRRGKKDNVVSPANYLDWKKRNQVFEGMSLVAPWTANLTGDGQPEEVRTHFVEPEFLGLLGVKPVLGRDLKREDASTDGPRAVLLGHAFWIRRFGGDAGVIGKGITLDGRPSTVVGVLPAGFRSIGFEPGMVAPFVLNEGRDYRRDAGRYLMTMGRLKAGMSWTQAQSEMSRIAAALEQEHRDFNQGWGVNLVPMQTHYAGQARSGLWVLMGAVGLVLLIACSNVANLLLVRAAGRQREMAVRGALGGEGLRIARQLMLESLSLAVAGGLVGSAIAYGLVWGLKRIAPIEVPRMETAAVNLEALGFALLVSLVTGLLFGLAPAVAGWRTDLLRGLKEGTRGTSPGKGGQRVRAALVVGQVALSCVLLVGAGLLMRNFRHLIETNPGFATEKVMTMFLSLPGPSGWDAEKTPRHIGEIVAGAQSVPGVEAASAITWLPFAGPGAATSYRAEGDAARAGAEAAVTDVRIIDPGFFATMQIPLRAGRVFTESDNLAGAPLRFVVSESMAREAFPGRDALGRRLLVSMGRGEPQWGEVIGVVGDIRTAKLSGTVRPMVYYPMAKLPFGFATLVMRVAGDPEAVARPMMSWIRERYPDQPVSEVRTMEEWVARSMRQQRFLALLLGGLSGLSLLLAAIGLYGVLSYTVAQRTREIGVRLALGAEPGRLRGEVLSGGMKLAGVGVVLGLGFAAALAPLLKPVLDDVRPFDPLSYAGALGVFSAVAFMAAGLPAHRATQVDPAVTLRDE